MRKNLNCELETHIARLNESKFRFSNAYERNYSSNKIQTKVKLMSNDGTIKLRTNYNSECVFIPKLRKNGSVCLSTQVGCTIGCRFCETGKSFQFKNLSSKEIVMQFLLLEKLLRSNNYYNAGKINSLVLMGMGEPLLNYNSTLIAIRIITRSKLFGITRRGIIISTSGIVSLMEVLMRRYFIPLAVSLHSINNILRNALVPLNKTFGVAAILNCCKKYVGKFKRMPVTFEYCAISNVNIFASDTLNLLGALGNLNCKLNIIPLNANANSRTFEVPSKSKLKEFCQALIKKGIRVSIREVRGNDINAACGQLTAGKIIDASKDI